VAKPIKLIHPREASEKDVNREHLAEIEAALVTHKTAVLEALDLLQGLHDRGVLPLFIGLLRAGDEVLAVLVNELNKPDSVRAIRNLVGLTEALGALDAEKLRPLVSGINSGLAEQQAQPQKTGLLGLWQAMQNPEVNAGLTMVLNMLKGIGKAYGGPSKQEK
jgi:uncharacterized protein YjgD (DUF1641 family)